MADATSIDLNGLVGKSVSFVQTYANQKALIELYHKKSPALWRAAQITTVCSIMANILLPNGMKRRLVKWPLVGRLIFYKVIKKVPMPTPPAFVPCCRCNESSSLKSLKTDVRSMRADIDIIAQHLRVKLATGNGLNEVQLSNSNQSLAEKIDVLCSRMDKMQSQLSSLGNR